MKQFFLLLVTVLACNAQPFTQRDEAFLFTSATRLPRANLVGEWFFNEGSGQTSYNTAVAKPTTAFVNLLAAPEQMFANTAFWNPVNTLAITDNYQTNASGITAATRVVATAGGARYLECKTKKITQAATPYTFSVYVKCTSSTSQPFRLGWQNTTDGYHWSADQTATTNWTRFSITYTPVSTANGNVIPISTDSANSAFDVVIWGAQLEAGSSATSYEDSNHHAILGVNRTVDTQDPFWTQFGFNLTNSRLSSAVCSTPITTTQMTVYVVAKKYATNSAFEPLVTDVFNGKWTLAHNDSSRRYPGFAFNGALARAPGVSLNDKNWHLLAGTYDGTTARVFFDDLQVTELVSTKAAITLNQINFGNFVGAYFWPGDIAYSSVYSSAHSSNQVKQSFASLRRVLNPRGALLNRVQRLLVLEGDSITDPYTSFDPNGRYWYLALSNTVPVVSGVIFAVSGSGTSHMTNRVESVDALFDPTREKNILSVFVGTNDLNTSQTATNVYANLKGYCLARMAKGWKVIVCTCLPRQWTGGSDAKRLDFNSFITGDSSFYHVLCDWAVDPTMGPAAASADVALYPDGVHPSNLGQDYLYPYFQTAFNSALAL